jgi:hypothetical protein
MASSIDGKGVAKLDSDSYRALRLGEGLTVTVTYGTKSLELGAVMDSVFSASTVRLMKPDMDSLRVESGTEVIVSKKNGNSQTSDKPAKGRKAKKPKAASLDRF